MGKSSHSIHFPYPLIIRQALSLNKHPFPWSKALCAGLAASLPVIIGLLFGLIAGLGGFTYLYVFQIPYAQAKKIFFVLLGITGASLLQTLAAHSAI